MIYSGSDSAEEIVQISIKSLIIMCMFVKGVCGRWRQSLTKYVWLVVHIIIMLLDRQVFVVTRSIAQSKIVNLIIHSFGSTFINQEGEYLGVEEWS